MITKIKVPVVRLKLRHSGVKIQPQVHFRLAPSLFVLKASVRGRYPFCSDPLPVSLFVFCSRIILVHPLEGSFITLSAGFRHPLLLQSGCL